MSHVVGVFLFESFLGFSPKQFGNMKFVICGEQLNLWEIQRQLQSLEELAKQSRINQSVIEYAVGSTQEFRREGWTEKRSAVCFCLGSGLFGSYNSD